MTPLDALEPEPPAPSAPRWRPRLLGERLVPAARHPGGRLPDDVIVLRPESMPETVVCCPLTGVPLTERMAEAAGLSVEALTHMVERRSPLGVTPETWSRLVAEIETALDDPDGGIPALSSAPVAVAIGGSAVACFSSAPTTLQKKHFPADESELEAMVRASPLNAGIGKAALAARVETARAAYRDLALGDRVPRAAWFNILTVLGDIEEAADLDFQMHSDLIDSVLTERAAGDPGIIERRDRDRLGRWHPLDVYAAFPALVRLQERLQALAPAAIEFLGPGGGRTIVEREDWWPVAERHGS